MGGGGGEGEGDSGGWYCIIYIYMLFLFWIYCLLFNFFPHGTLWLSFLESPINLLCFSYNQLSSTHPRLISRAQVNGSVAIVAGILISGLLRLGDQLASLPGGGKCVVKSTYVCIGRLVNGREIN